MMINNQVWKFKTPVLELLFNNVADLQGFSCEYCNIFKDIYFEEHLRTAASVHLHVCVDMSEGFTQKVYQVRKVLQHDVTKLQVA